MKILLSKGLQKALKTLGDTLQMELVDVVQDMENRAFGVLCEYEMDCMTAHVVARKSEKELTLAVLE